jgi:hypothetical protein
MKGRGKYGAIRTEVHGITFDSKGESGRYMELQTLQKIGQIYDLQLQVKYEIFAHDSKICTYIADFVYQDVGGCTVIEDFKGVVTAVFKLKWKLLQAQYREDIDAGNLRFLISKRPSPQRRARLRARQ